MLFLWPFSMQRHHFPFRPIPDIPTGLKLFSRLGARQLLTELVILRRWSSIRCAGARCGGQRDPPFYFNTQLRFGTCRPRTCSRPGAVGSVAATHAAASAHAGGAVGAA